ncbi:MAG TPA: glycosyltransferase family 2 protein [Vicinamibacterales bacterium]
MTNPESPRVSVVMTAYNRADYLTEAIESVLAQSFADFELIVVDDHSTDDTVGVARKYLTDPRVRVMSNAHNLGDYPNRNFAASLARGEYLKYHDSDDVMYGHCLQVMVSAMDSESRADFALTSHRSWPGGPSPMLLTPRRAYEREFLGTGIFQLGPSCGLFRRRFFESIGGFPEEGGASDYLFWFKACARGRALLVPGDLFYYRVHAGQMLQRDQNAIEYAHARRLAWSQLSSSGCPLDRADLERAKRNFVFTLARDVYYQVRDGNLKAARALFGSLDARTWARYLRLPLRSPETAAQDGSVEQSATSAT